MLKNKTKSRGGAPDEILIISGKGGTGKTSLTAAFAHLAKNHVICDLDVDAPDMHLILKPENIRSHDFISGHEAMIVEENGSPAAPVWKCAGDAIVMRGTAMPH
ncbi:MAG: hypothetical protein R2875_12265 [Desulfobacterales bacterium]